MEEKMSDCSKIVVLKPICLFEIDRYRSTIAALFKELVKNKFFVSPENTWVSEPSIEQVKKIVSSPEETYEFVSGKILCVEVVDEGNKITEIVKQLNSTFSPRDGKWIDFFEGEKVLEIKTWVRLNG